jgi:hypothetical protein
MAGTLQVENLIGPTSGANTNTVSIPSGQTLDASGATLLPSAGQIVQCVKYAPDDNSWTGTTSTSYVATKLQVDITPKFANSLIKIEATHNYWWSASTLDNASYATFAIYRNNNHNISGNTGSVAVLEGTYYNLNNYNRHVSYIDYDSPNTTSSTNYRVYFRQWTAVSQELRTMDGYSSTAITVSEIAQ